MDRAADWTKNWYHRWAQVEARGLSPIYERLASAVAGDGDTLDFLQEVEPARRQPNLLFGVLRWYGVPVQDPPAALEWLHEHHTDVLTQLRTRRTQTNEVARCATLLPALALLPAPLVLIEVGASAGLCLLYDAWRYHYAGPGVNHWVGPPDGRPTLTCTVSGPVPLPTTIPAIAWRAGLDVNPLDPADPDARRWLQALIWPEHHDRARRLDIALDVAATRPARIDAGDLTRDLPALLDQAPGHATVVVTHSATLAYLDQDQRAAFVALLERRGVHRLGAEDPATFPELSDQVPRDIDLSGRFVISLDHRGLALAQPHGGDLTWL